MTVRTPQRIRCDKRHTIDAGAESTLARLYTAANGSRELVGKARGVLVFPSVIAAGFGLGGQYGEGSLRVGGSTVGYYSTATASTTGTSDTSGHQVRSGGKSALNRKPSSSCS